MADNIFTWVKNLNGAPMLVFPGKVQAGSTQEIKRGEICAYNETSGYFVPVDAVADYVYSLAVANEEQKADGLARYMEFIALRPEDVFEYPLDASAQAEIGNTLTLTASDSQALTRDVDGFGVAVVVGRENYPESGTTLLYRSYAQVCFHPEFSYWMKNVLQTNLKKIMAKTAAYTIKLEDCGAVISNKGATGSVTLTAPTSVVPVGFNFKMAVMADQAFLFDPKPNTASVYIKGAAQTAGKYVSMTDIGDFAEFVWDGTDWLAVNSISGADGDITVEG